MQKKHYVTLFFSVIFGLFAILLFFLFKPFLSAIAWAIILATLSYPLYLKLHKALKTKSETLPAVIMTLAILFVLILPATFLTASLGTEMIKTYSYVEQNLINQPGKGKEWFDKTADFFAQYNVNLRNVINTNVKSASSWLAAQTGDLVKGFFKNIVIFFLTIFTLFFIFKHGLSALQELKWIIPLSNRQKEQIFARFQEVLYAIMYGILLTAIIQGTLGGFGFYFIGLPYPVVFGAMMALCALLPAGGTSLVWIPASVILFLNDEIGKSLFLILWGFLVVGLIDNFMKPIFISGRSKINFILVFFGIFGGINLFGLVGIFAGPLIIAIFLALLEIFKLERSSKPKRKRA